MDEGNVSFEDWTYLQKCLKYEKIRVNHGKPHIDENEKKDLLNQLDNLLKEYYSSQLIIRESYQESTTKHKRLLPDAHSFLGDNFRYAEQMVFMIRSNPEIFNFISQSCRQPKDGTASLIESFGYSFFLDLIHPENTELELVNVMHRLIHSELEFLVSTGGNINNLLNENFVLKNMLRLYMRRKNQRKYMKLVFRKPLREIIHDQETIKELKLEPKAIYKAENERMMKYNNEEVVQVPQKKKSFFGGSSKKAKPVKEVQKIEVTEEEALSHPQVKSIIEARSEIIINHCRSLLNALYKNVRTMPFGLRGICKRMALWIEGLEKKQDEKTVFNLLGIFLFTSWWIPAILDPIKSGLLQNVIINTGTLNCLKTIATILKNLFKETFFDEPHYFVINKFILEEKEKLKAFFREIIDFDESTFTKTKVKKSRQSEAVSIDKKSGSMFNYFMMTSRRISTPQFSFNSQTHKQMQHMNEMKEFRISTVMLSLDEIKFLSKLFEENEDKLNQKQWTDLARYAKNLRSAERNGTLFQQSFLREQGFSEEDSLYLLFINKKLGPGLDSEVAYVPKHNFSTNPEENKLLTKVIDATKNLVLYLDMSIFFDPSREWSLYDVVEFVIQFSYLFENKKANMQNAIPMKLLAQFLAAYLKTIPITYKSHNFRKLYTALIKDYEERFEFKRRLANRNKKLLLLAVNFMEKHIIDIKQEIRVFESVKRKEFFLRFIKKGKVAACLLSIRDNNGNLTIQVFPQSSCPHSKLASVNEFVMGKKIPSKSGHPSEATHVNNIEEFYQKFMKLDQVVNSTEKEDDPYKVGEAFFEYMNVIKGIIFDTLKKEDDTENACEEIEKYITSCMYKDIFPQASSIEDMNLHQKALELDWIKPEHLDIVPANRNEDMWKLAIEAMELMETYRAPAEKLNCLLDCMSIIVNVLTLVSAGQGVSTDDSLPIIIYIVIKAKPNRLYSNLNYISKFRHSSKMIGLKGFVFQQFQSAAAFILTADNSCFSISLEDFEKNVQASREKHGITN